MKKQWIQALSLMGVLVIPLLALLPSSLAEAQTASQVEVLATATPVKVYMPVVYGPSCSTGATYGTINMIPPVADHVDYNHADLNLDLRGYRTTSDTPLGLKAISGATEATAPQLDSLFSPARVPTFVQNYQIGNWDWSVPPDGVNPGTFTTDPPVTLAGFLVSRSEKIFVPTSTNTPISSNPIYNVAVLYATSRQITFIYTAQDTVASGYAIHIDKICVDPSLVSLYQAMNAAGRDYLPALRNGQAIGYPIGTEIVVAIVDRGAFMDPRSCKDWWKSHWNGSTGSPQCT